MTHVRHLRPRNRPCHALGVLVALLVMLWTLVPVAHAAEGTAEGTAEFTAAGSGDMNGDTSGDVSGRVSGVLGMGALPEGLVVELYRAVSHPRGSGFLTQGTAPVAPDGRYRFSDVQPGSFLLKVRDPDGRWPTVWAPDVPDVEELGFASALARTAVLPPGGEVSDLDVRVRPPVGASGVVRDTEGSPVGGATVEFLGSEGELVGTATTDRSGRYRVEVLPRGRFRVLVTGWEIRTIRSTYHPGTLSAADADLVRTGVDELDLDLLALPGATLSGTVRITGPQKPTSVTVWVFRREGTASRPVWKEQMGVDASADGTWRLGSLPAGTYRALAGPPGWHPSTDGADSAGGAAGAGSATDVVLEEGQDVTGIEVDVDLGPYVRGTVLGPDGDPAPGVGIWFEPLMPGRPQHSQVTDEQGEFTLIGLTQGHYVIGVAGDGVLPPQYADGAADRSQARRIAVGAGGTSVTVRLSPARPATCRTDGAGPGVAGPRLPAMSWVAAPSDVAWGDWLFSSQHRQLPAWSAGWSAPE